MSKGKSWFIAIYASMFSGLFVLIYLLFVLYKGDGFSYFPDWNSFVSGYSSVLWDGEYSSFVSDIKFAMDWCLNAVTRMLTWNNMGQGTPFYWLTLTLGSIMLVTGPAWIVATTFLIGAAIMGVCYLLLMVVPLFASAGFLLTCGITQSNIPGAGGAIEYYSGVGYPPVTSPVIHLLTARFF